MGVGINPQLTPNLEVATEADNGAAVFESEKYPSREDQIGDEV